MKPHKFLTMKTIKSLFVLGCFLLSFDVAMAQSNSLDNLNFYAIKAANGKYWSARNDGKEDIEATRDGVGFLEIFLMEELSDTQFGMKALINNMYVYCKDDKTPLVASREVRNVKETYEKIQLDGPLHAIKAHNGKYLRAIDNGGGKIQADRDRIGDHEQFTLLKLDKFQFQTLNGYFLGAKDGKVKANFKQEQDNTIFEIVENNKRAYLKSMTGKYVSVSDNEMMASASSMDDATGFTYRILNTRPYLTIKLYDTNNDKVFAVGGGGFAVKTDDNPSDLKWADFYLRPLVD